MKNSIRVFIVLCLLVGAWSSLKSQSTYTVTNNTNNSDYYVELHIANHPTECEFDATTTNRSVVKTVGTSGSPCPSQATESLGANEWVYKVEIYEFTNCSSCSGNVRYVGSIELCPVAPMGTQWNGNCDNDEAAGNRTTYLDIDDQ